MLSMVCKYLFFLCQALQGSWDEKAAHITKRRRNATSCCWDEWNCFSPGETRVPDVTWPCRRRVWEQPVCRKPGGYARASEVRLYSGWLHSSLSKGQLILSFFFLRPSSFLLLLQRVYIYTKLVIRNTLIHTAQTMIFHVLWDDQANWAVWSCFLGPETGSFMLLDLERSNDSVIVDYNFKREDLYRKKF